jgi:hypothetical protein
MSEEIMPYDVILFTEFNSRFYHIKNLGPYRIATELRKNGYSVKVLDFFSEWLKCPKDLHKVLQAVIGPNTLFVGFSGTFFNNHNWDQEVKSYQDYHGPNWDAWPLPQAQIEIFLKALKKYSSTLKLVYGGILADHQIDRVANQVDYIIPGLADVTVIELADHLSKKTPIKFMLTGKKAKLIAHDTKAQSFDFPNSHVEYLDTDHIRPGEIMPLETSRGCLFQCSFCTFPLVGRKKGDPAYHKNIKIFAEELRRNYENYKIDTYMMVDDTFNESTEKICSLLKARDLSGVDIKFSAYIRCDLLNRFPEQIALLSDLGLRSAFFGIESLYQPSARAIGKSTHPEKIKETLYAVKQQSNPPRILGSFIIGLPYDNPETLNPWLDWLDTPDCPIDTPQTNVLFLNDSSKIAMEPQKFGYEIDAKTKFWRNQYWDQDQAMQFVLKKQQQWWQSGRYRLAAWDYMGFQNLGYSESELCATTMDQLNFDELRLRRKQIWNEYKQQVLNFETFKS